MINNIAMLGNEYEFYKKIEPELDLIIDAGARDSFFLGVNCYVHFFEPDSEEFNSLSKNVNDKYTFNKLGLGSESKEVTLYNNIGSTYNRFGHDVGQQEKIIITRLDSYISENNIKEISLLKIDTEGMEYEILLGMGDYLDICKYIVFEYAWDTAEAAGVKFSDIKNILKNYNLFEMGTNGDLINVNELKITNRVYPNTNNIVAKNKKNG